jgi:hypothetical protein
VPNPEIVEAEQTLYERATVLHPTDKLPPLADLPASLSRFRKSK